MQLFSADGTIFKKQNKMFFAPENMEKPTSKVAHDLPKFIFFSIANRPKTTPNLNFYSIKIANCVTSLVLGH
jgi:hypothetical protein